VGRPPLKGRRRAAVLAAAVVTATATPARAGVATLEAQDLNIPVMIQTVPSLPGMRFWLGGREFVADSHGLALITVGSPGSYSLRAETDRALAWDGRARFVRWSDGSLESLRAVSVHSFTYLEAGFEVSYEVVPRFVDEAGDPLGPDAVRGITVLDAAGNSATWRPGRPLRLVATRPVATQDDLRVEAVSYAIESMVLQDQRVPGPAQAPFSPSAGRRAWIVEVALYDLRLVAVDALFRTPLSAPVAISYPDGRVRTARPGASGEVVFSSLPPGDYEARARAGGWGLPRSVGVPTSSEVRLSVVTARDAAAAVAVTAALVLVLALARGPLRGAVRAPRRPEPQPGEGAPTAPAASGRGAREHVRVRLSHGRVIEGWREPQPASEERPAVWVLDVERVFDPDGREVASIPRDSFLIAAHIVEVERLDAGAAQAPGEATVIRLDEESSAADEESSPEIGRGS
jgi:hypothetical protein